MTDDDNVIDAEVVELADTPNVPAVIAPAASSSEGIKLPNRQDTLLADNAERRCVAHKANGQRCRKFAILGATVCRTHGGATKAVKNKARIRVENAADRLVGKLIDFAFDDAKPPDVQLRAIRDALDRSGLKPPSEVVLSQGEPKAYEQVFDGIYSGPEGQAPGTDVADVGILSVPTQPEPADPRPPRDQARPRSGVMNTDDDIDEYGDASKPDGPPRRPRPRSGDRDRQSGPPSRHITGEAAMQAANWANQAMAESHGLPWGESDRRRR